MRPAFARITLTACRVWPLICLLTLLIGGAGPIQASGSDLCDAAAARAAAESGVPRDVLLAITRAETGRTRNGRFAPWPWTVNMEGKGRWFDSRAAALAHAVQAHDGGARSFDVGCFQINYRWHGQNFDSIAQMFDPLENARYAARFLMRLHGELGDWSKAAGAYHSRTERHALRYRTRFDRFRKSVAERGLAMPGPVTEPAQRETVDRRHHAEAGKNSYPLLRPAGAGRNGSLVPLVSGGRELIPMTGGS